jgi:gliding motility-associated-like protein
LTLIRTGNSTLPIENNDFQNVLRTLQWHNDAPSKSPGQRIIEVIAFCSGARTDTSFAFIEVPLLLTAGADTTFAICANGAPIDLFTPGASVGGVWSPTSVGAGVFSPQTDLPGTYVYSVANANCPSDTALVEVSLLPPPVFSLGADTSLCANETLTLLTLGNALWQDGSIASQYEVSAAGLYWASFEASNGCEYTDSITVQLLQPTQAQSSIQQCAGQAINWNGQTILSDTSICLSFVGANGCDSIHCLSASFFYPEFTLDTSICSGQSLLLHGTTYSISGTYTDTVQLQGCRTVLNLKLDVTPADTVSASASICNGDSYSVGGQSFSTPGNYAVWLQTASGCDSVVVLNLSVEPPIESSIAATICSGGSYTFAGMDRTLPGTYSAVFQSTNGCDSTVTLQLSLGQPIEANISQYICSGSSYAFNGTDLTQAGTYSAQLQTQGGCDSVVVLSLGLNPIPAPHISGDTIFCSGASTVLNAGNFLSYQWSNAAGTPDILVPDSGIYSVTVTDQNGCTGNDEIQVLQLPPITAEWTVNDPQCNGSDDGSLQLESIVGGVGRLQFQLNGTAATDSGTFFGLSAGTQELIVMDSLGCTAEYTFTLSEPSVLTLDIGENQTLDAGAQYEIPISVNHSGPFEYFWWPSNGLSCNTCSQPTITASDSMVYYLLIKDESGCESHDSIVILVRKGEGIYIPQVFSPNGDGKNDFFAVFADPGLVGSVEWLRVYDRWGELLYEQTDLAPNDERSGWDGIHRGRTMLPGVYVWQAQLRLKNGSVLYKKGDLTLLR